jgi:hypothetical protein
MANLGIGWLVKSLGLFRARFSLGLGLSLSA